MKNLNNKGITLITLVVTIIVLLILASVATYSGIDIINSSKITAFTTELKLMQSEVNSLYNKAKNNEEVTVDGTKYTGTEIFDNLGKSVSEEPQLSQANIVFTEGASGIIDKSEYRYFDQATIKGLNIEGIEQEFFINVEKRSIVSYKGLNYENEMYYTLEQLPDSVYNVQYDSTNTGKPGISVSYEQIGTENYRINVSVVYTTGNIEKWNVKYKLSEEEQWNTSYDLSFIVNKAGKYNIKVENDGIESEQEEITIVNKKNIEYVDSNGDVAIIPEGFYLSNVSGEQTINKGLVVIDSDENEFVWIPVKDITKMAILKEESTIDYRGVLYDWNNDPTGNTPYTWNSDRYREPDNLNSSYDNETNMPGWTNKLYQTDYNSMVVSVSKYGGFYVGRYETSLNGTIAQSKKGEISATAGDNSQGWYGLYSKQKNYQVGSTQGQMIWGSQYDAMLKWMLENNINVASNHPITESSMNTGNITGAEEKDKLNNIYDILGNKFEWTAEAISDYLRINRSRKQEYS